MTYQTISTMTSEVQRLGQECPSAQHGSRPADVSFKWHQILLDFNNPRLQTNHFTFFKRGLVIGECNWQMGKNSQTHAATKFIEPN